MTVRFWFVCLSEAIPAGPVIVLFGWFIVLVLSDYTAAKQVRRLRRLIYLFTGLLVVLAGLCATTQIVGPPTGTIDAFTDGMMAFCASSALLVAALIPVMAETNRHGWLTKAGAEMEGLGRADANYLARHLPSVSKQIPRHRQKVAS